MYVAGLRQLATVGDDHGHGGLADLAAHRLDLPQHIQAVHHLPKDHVLAVHCSS